MSAPAAKRKCRKRKVKTSLLASAGVHLAAIVLLVPDPPALPAARDIVELDLVSEAPPPETAPNAPGQSREQSQATAATPVQPRAWRPKRSRRRRPGLRRVRRPGGTPGPPLHPAPAPAPPDRLRLAMRTRPLDLTPDPIPLEPRAAPQTAPARPEKSVKQRLDELLARDKARTNVHMGDVDPLLYDIRRDAEYFFQPTWGMSTGDQRRIGTVASTTRSFVKAVGRNYLEGLKKYSAVGQPRGKESEPPTMLDIYDRMRRVAADDADKLRCSICVTVGWGEKPGVKLSSSSRRAPFDRMATRALLRAVARRPPARRDRPVRACYDVTASFHRVPPLPVVGCNFDEVELTLACFYPFKKILKTSVKLTSVRYLTPAASGKGQGG